MAVSLSFAQKIDLDREIFTVRYRVLAQKPLAPDYKTFSVSVSLPQIMKNYYSADVENRIEITGMKQITTGKGHIHINILAEDIIIEGASVKSRTTSEKDRNGVVVNKSYFWSEIVYTFGLNTKIIDYHTQQSIDSYSFAERKTKKIFKSQEFTEYNSANSFLEYNKDNLKAQIATQEFDNAFKTLNTNLNVNYGYTVGSASQQLWIMDSPKHVENKAHIEATKNARNILNTINANDNPKDLLPQLAPSIEYFTKTFPKYPVDDKPSKKIRYSCYYNLALIYFWTEDYNNANKYANEIIVNDYDTGDGKAIIAAIKDIQIALNKNKLTSRHFPIDLSNVEGPK